MASKNLKVSYGIVTAMIGVFLMERRALGWGLASPLFEDFSFRWDAFVSQPWDRFPTLFSHTFLHAGWDHLIFNLLFFLLFAPGVEEAMGRGMFLLNFFLWGAAAALIHGFFWPFSGGLIGASGAISGAAGAFFVFYPLRKPRFLKGIPSFFWIGLWFLAELKSSFLSFLPATAGQISVVAHGAHVGGFVVGAVSTLPALLKRKGANPP